MFKAKKSAQGKDKPVFRIRGVFRVDTKGITIVGGVNKIAGEDTSSGKREERTVKSITVDGEAAILELAEQWPDFLDSTPAPKNRYFQSVCLPVNWKENIGEYGVVAGFGTNESE